MKYLLEKSNLFGRRYASHELYIRPVSQKDIVTLFINSYNTYSMNRSTYAIS